MASDFKLAFHSSTTAMMHGPINIRVLTLLQTSHRTSMEVRNKNGLTLPLHLRLLRMCPSFIHHISSAQALSNSVSLLVNLTLVFSSINSDHSSYLLSVNIVIHLLYYVQSIAQNNARSGTTICLILRKVFL